MLILKNNTYYQDIDLVTSTASAKAPASTASVSETSSESAVSVSETYWNQPSLDVLRSSSSLALRLKNLKQTGKEENTDGY